MNNIRLLSLCWLRLCGHYTTMDRMIARPFIKWAGGKQSLAPYLVNTFPSDMDRFYEPFVGGGSVFLSLSHYKSTISDNNKWLIDTYIAIRDFCDDVSDILSAIKNDKETFLRIRALHYNEVDLVNRAANFIYLNKTCFRGLFRVNKKGMFNVPYGAYDRRYFDPQNLYSVSDVLKNIEIRFGDFEYGLYGVNKSDFVYFDPPYYELGGYSDFNRYTESKFSEYDHMRLASLCRELDFKGIRWSLSNSNTPYVRWLFEGFEIKEIDNRREINLSSKNRSIKELLISNH